MKCGNLAGSRRKKIGVLSRRERRRKRRKEDEGGRRTRSEVVLGDVRHTIVGKGFEKWMTNEDQKDRYSLKTQSRLPSSVLILTENPRGSRAVSGDPDSCQHRRDPEQMKMD